MKRFFDKVDKTSFCWNWIAASRGNGYGCMKINGKVIDAHRISFELHYGKIPEGMLVCHRCDNRKCVRPDHLFLGSYSDNMKDAYQKGKVVSPVEGNFKVENVPTGSLLKDENQIKVIKKSIINRTCTLKQLSINFDVPYQLIRDISCGRAYKNY